MTPDEFRASGHDLIDWIADYLGGIERYRVQPDVEPGQIRAMLPADPPTRPEPFSAVMEDVERIVLPGITHWQHPNFYAYFPANSSFPSILGELLSAGLGVNGMSWVTSPACTEIETAMVDWMATLLDLPDAFRSDSVNGGGVIQATASEATLTSILSARWRATDGNVNRTGGAAIGDLVAYTTAHAHSSIEKGLRIAGIGTERIRVVSMSTATSPCVRMRSRRPSPRTGRQDCNRSGSAPATARRVPPRSIRRRRSAPSRDVKACGSTSTVR